MKRKNRHWYNLGQEYNRAEFEVRILVGAGLTFEIWSKDGIRSQQHNEIHVDWESAEDNMRPSAAIADKGQGMDRW